jgi:hypothetical protein
VPLRAKAGEATRGFALNAHFGYPSEICLICYGLRHGLKHLAFAVCRGNR